METALAFKSIDEILKNARARNLAEKKTIEELRRLTDEVSILLSEKETLEQRCREKCEEYVVDRISKVGIMESANNLIKNVAFDLMSQEDVTLKDYLQADLKNIVFIIDGRFLLLSKETIETQRDDLYWACKRSYEGRLYNEDNIDGEAMMSIRKLGGIGGYILLEDMFTLILPNKNNIFLLEKTKEIPGVVSKEMRFNPNADASSASHCQPDADFVYNAKLSVHYSL